MAARYHSLRRYVQRIMTNNLHWQAIGYPEHALYINPSSLVKATGFPRTVVVRFLADHAAQVDAHHAAMGWATPGEGTRHNTVRGLRERDARRRAHKQATVL